MRVTEDVRQPHAYRTAGPQPSPSPHGRGDTFPTMERPCTRRPPRTLPYRSRSISWRDQKPVFSGLRRRRRFGRDCPAQWCAPRGCGPRRPSTPPGASDTRHRGEGPGNAHRCGGAQAPPSSPTSSLRVLRSPLACYRFEAGAGRTPEL